MLPNDPPSPVGSEDEEIAEVEPIETKIAKIQQSEGWNMFCTTHMNGYSDASSSSPPPPAESHDASDVATAAMNAIFVGPSYGMVNAPFTSYYATTLPPLPSSPPSDHWVDPQDPTSLDGDAN